MKDPPWLTAARAEGRIRKEVRSKLPEIQLALTPVETGGPQRPLLTQWHAVLPFPPTVNSYWNPVVVWVGGKAVAKIILSERGREYRQQAVLIATSVPGRLSGPVRVEITFHPPDRRKRDLDNLWKSVLDAVAHAGVLADDSQMRRQEAEWGEIVKGGSAVVTITPWPAR